MNRIVLADDSKTIQKVVKLSFGEEGYHVECFSDGISALRHLRKWGADLVLADVTLPGQDGYSLCRALKQEPSTSGIPCVLLAGSLQPVNPEQLASAGADAVLTKPFETSQLVATAEEMILRRRSEQEALLSASLPVESAPEGAPSEPSEEPEAPIADVIFALSREQCSPDFHSLCIAQWVRPDAGELTEEQYRAIVDLVAQRLPEALRDIVPQAAREVLGR